MRLIIPATTVTVVSLIVAGLLGVASAEAPTATTPPPTVSVQGVATEPIEQSASSATATAVYRQGMADSITDGQAKAQFLASKAGVTLGSVQSIVEGGGYIGCTGGEESSNDEYQGAQPDFGSPGATTSTPVFNAPRALNKATPDVRKPAAKHGKKKPKKPSVKQASATTTNAKTASAATTKATTASVTTCTLSTQVSLVYTLG
jgi:hypothetical protein